MDKTKFDSRPPDVSIAKPGLQETALRRFVEMIPAVGWHALPDGQFQFFTKYFQDYTGLTPDESSGMGWNRAIHPDDLSSLLETWSQIRASGKSGDMNCRVRRFDGEYRYVTAHIVPSRNEQGDVDGWYGCSLDIEEHKQTERLQRAGAIELRSVLANRQTNKLEAQLRRFVEMIPAVAWQASPDGQFTFFTKYYEEYTGLTPEEYLGTGFQRTIHPDDLPRALAEWAAIRASGEPGDLAMRIRRFDGVYRFVTARAVPYRDEQGVIQGWYGCSIDIEQQKQTERQQRSGAQELRSAMDMIGGLIAVIDHDGAALYMNKELRQYTGLTITDILLKKFQEIAMHPADGDVYKRHPAEIKAGIAFTSVLRIRRHDGQFRWHQVRYNPLRDADNVIIRWYSTAIDVHEQHVSALRLENENVALREEITRSSMFEEIVGSSQPMQRVLSSVQKVAKSDSTVLIVGETGTGKELIARAVHIHSLRAAKAFIRVNCAAIPPALIASELFGHEKGAFTGALHKRLGRFEAADGGTLFLDEIGDLPMETQIALLRVLQEREFERIGSQESISVDVRVVAATNVDLAARMAAGTFRQDLFYRLNVFPIALPSLRERSDDIPLLVEYFVERYARRAGKHIKRIDRATLELLRTYKWPGNIRELQNVIERSVILCDCDVLSIDASWLNNAGKEAPVVPHTLSVEMANREKELIEQALKAAGGRVAGPAGAAARLNMPRQTLTSKMKALGIPKR